MISTDQYYRDLSHLPLHERSACNFDHPDALDNALLLTHLDALREGHAIDLPVYDFQTHLRSTETIVLPAVPIVIVEGILNLVDPELRSRMNLKIFVDTDADIRVFRRIRRDIESRGRSFERVREQYYTTVRPMHLRFVEPSKAHADLVIPEGGDNVVAIDLLVTKLRTVLEMSAAPERPSQGR